MNKLDKLLKEALDNQRKIDETLKFLKENEEHLTEEQEDKLDEIKYKMKEELLPEIEKLGLFDVSGSYSAEDMGKAWSEGYHRKIDEINGNKLTYFDVWLANYR